MINENCKIWNYVTRRILFIGLQEEIYNFIKEIQEDAYKLIKQYNELNPYSGKYCYDKASMQTFLDSKYIAIDAIYG